MEKRVYNFSPGPSMLPLPALEEAQRDLLSLPGVGSSVMEISHRSKTFTAIIEGAEANLRKLLSIPDNYRVLFLQGGAQMQFAMVPLNLLRGTGKHGTGKHCTDKTADYIVTGTWGKKAMQEAKTLGKVNVAFDCEATNYNRVPTQDELNLTADAAYVHITSNETIQGVQFPTEPDVGDVPLVCDASSDIMCRPTPIDRYGILYACAQKNIGPSGVTLVIIRDDLVERASDDLPSMLSYKTMVAGKSLHNTPPTFPIYMVKLVTDWLLREIGSLEKMAQINQQKIKLVYDAIEQCGTFYQAHAEPDSRSLMNVAFRLANTDLDAPFLKQAEARGLASLKGHRSVGGCRASMYNAMPIEGVQLLRDFMIEFCEKNK